MQWLLYPNGAIMSIPVGPFRRIPLGGGAKVPPPFFPLGFSHLEEYYDSRTPNVANGANVTTWADLSGNARNMGASDPSTTVPKMLTGGSPKGTNLIRSSSVLNTCMVSGTINPFPAATRGWTYYTYADFRSVVGSQLIWTTSLFGSAPKELDLQASNKTGWRDSGGFHLQITPNITGVHQLAYVFTPPSGTGLCQMYIDGVATGAPAVWTIAGAAADTTQLFNSYNFNTPADGDYGHHIWYSDAHSPATVALFKLWASVYWGF